MAKRATKRIVIALVLVFILAGFAFLIYYLSQPSPTCSDGIQNQGEEDVDCGGPCSPCALVHIEEIEVLWTKAILAQENFYDLAAQIKNPNQNYGSSQVSYQFELYDSGNTLTGQYGGMTFILPNQTKYLLQIKAESVKPVSKVKLTFGEIDWQKPEDYQSPQLFIQQKEYRLLESDEVGFSQARAVLLNRTNFDFDKVDIDVLLFDSFHNLLALNTTEIRTVLAGQERDFVVTWFQEISGQVSSVEMEAETNIFDPTNYLSPRAGEPEEFQEY